jgi:hypothetical protein
MKGRVTLIDDWLYPGLHASRGATPIIAIANGRVYRVCAPYTTPYCRGHEAKWLQVDYR